jgi:hypothetical protein
MPEDGDVGQSVPNLQRKLVEVEIRVEEIALVLATRFKGKVFPLLLVEEVFLPCCRFVWYTLLFPNLRPRAIRAFGVDDRFALTPADFYIAFCLYLAF